MVSAPHAHNLLQRRRPRWDLSVVAVAPCGRNAARCLPPAGAPASPDRFSQWWRGEVTRCDHWPSSVISTSPVVVSISSCPRACSLHDRLIEEVQHRRMIDRRSRRNSCGLLSMSMAVLLLRRTLLPNATLVPQSRRYPALHHRSSVAECVEWRHAGISARLFQLLR